MKGLALAVLVLALLASVAQTQASDKAVSEPTCRRLASNYGRTFVKSLFDRGGKLGSELCARLEKCRNVVKSTHSVDSASKMRRPSGPTNSRHGQKPAKKPLSMLGSSKSELHWIPLDIGGERPPARKGHTMVRYGGYMYMFGGCNDGDECYNDVYGLDLKKKEWFKAKTSGTPPSPRMGHTMVAMNDGTIVVFGGKERRVLNVSGSVEDDGEVAMVPTHSLYTLDTNTLRWSRAKSTGELPAARFGHTAVVRGGSMLVYGGHNGKKHLGDVHLWNTGSHEWTKPAVEGHGPAPRFGHTATDALGGMAVFGGHSSGQAHNDVHVLKQKGPSSFYWDRPAVAGLPPSRRGFHDTLPLQDGGIRIVGGCGTTKDHCYHDSYDLPAGTMHWKRNSIGLDYFTLPQGRALTPAPSSDGGAYGFGGCSSEQDFHEADSGCTNNFIIFGDDDDLPGSLDLAETEWFGSKKKLKKLKRYLKSAGCDPGVMKKPKDYCKKLLKKIDKECSDADEICKKEVKEALSDAKKLQSKQKKQLIEDANKKAKAAAEKIAAGEAPDQDDDDDDGDGPDTPKKGKKGKKGKKKGGEEEGEDDDDEGEGEGEGEGGKRKRKKKGPKDSMTPGAPGAPGSRGVKPPVAAGANRTEVVDDDSARSNNGTSDGAEDAEKAAEQAAKDKKAAEELERCKHAQFEHKLNGTQPKQAAHVVQLICMANYEMVREPINMKMIAHSVAEYLNENGHVVGVKNLRRADDTMELVQLDENWDGDEYGPRAIWADDRRQFLALVEEGEGALPGPPPDPEDVEKNDKVVIDLIMPHEAVSAFRNSSLSSKCFKADLNHFGIDKCTNVTDMGIDAKHVIQPADPSQFKVPPSQNGTGPVAMADHAIFRMGYPSCTSDCGPHGTCGPDGKCDCDPMYYIPPGSNTGKCEKRTTELTCAQTAKKCMFGECTPAGTCECYPGYESAADGCKVKLKCPNDCSDHGTCEWGACWCSNGWGGDDGDCSKDIRCPSAGCDENNAYCYRSKCYCKQGYTGSKCQYGPISEEEMELWKAAKKLGVFFLLGLLLLMVLAGSAVALLVLAVQHLWGKRDKLNQIASGQLLDNNEVSETKPYRSEVWRRRDH